jgi:DNA invertase Pin-like site-specific DNA recombinase
MKRLDGYVRVSQSAGRSGESFISPSDQRKKIEAYAAGRGFVIAEVFEDIDQSGGKMERPGLDRVLARIEAGESGGIVVSKIDRFARSLVGALRTIERIQDAGGVILSAEGDFDTSTPTGRMVVRMMLTLAEFELERIRESWSTSQATAVARGVHIASRVPTGYRRREDKRLEPDPAAIPVIRELFRRRARGEGWTALARLLDESGVRGPYENSLWTASAVSKMLSNRVYLGEARSGRYVNSDAHEPLVTRAEFEAAQGKKTVAKPRNGDGLLLAGLVRCQGCRYLVKPDTMQDRDGSRLGLYRCRVRHAAGKCPAPATIMARILDPYVEAQFLAALGPDGPLAQASEASTAIEDAIELVQDAERELDDYLAATPASVVGPERFRAGLEERQRALGASQAALNEARQGSAFVGELTPGKMLEAWPSLSVSEKRHLLTAAVDAVVIRAVRGSGRAVPVEERVRILWRGQGPDDFPGRGRRVPLALFPWDENPANLAVASR